MPAGEFDALRAAIEQQLSAAGADAGQSETKIRIVVSENPSDFLLIGQNNGQVTIASWRKPPPAASEFTISMHIVAVWQQRAPILDVMLFNSDAGMAVLEPERIAQYARNGAEWRLEHVTPLTLARPTARDPRGRLTGAPPAFEAWMPSRNEPEPGRFPYRWAPGRNYFDGGDRGLFFSAADLGATGVLLAGMDARTRLYGAKPEPAVTISDWGSDIAPITSQCGSKTQVLATAPGTDGAPDRVQAFEVSGASYSAVSEAALLPGPVTALWTAERSDQATLVVQNRQTGMYEASRVSLVCSK
jgi:hypothetical protein